MLCVVLCGLCWLVLLVDRCLSVVVCLSSFVVWCLLFDD